MCASRQGTTHSLPELSDLLSPLSRSGQRLGFRRGGEKPVSSSVVASLTILAAVWLASSLYAVSLFIATVRIGSPSDFCFDTSNFSISAVCPSGDTPTTLYTPTNPSGTTS